MMKRLLVCLLPVALLSCTPYQKITYPTKDISVTSPEKTLPIMVEVRMFNDNRAQIAENKVLFSSPQKTKIEGKSVCINSEKFYKKDSVASQITRILVEHFNKAGLFKQTFYKENSLSGYYMTGTLNSFLGEQQFSTGAAVGSQFGLIGALATAGIKTPGKVVIEIADLKLYKKDGTLVKDFGSFYKEYKDDYKADGYCWCMYTNINDKLKDFNSHLIDKIRSDLTSMNFE